MPIHSGDVKLLKSAVMADVPEGGGAPTGNAIADGVSNAIFPDISELDRAGGRVNLRKSFVSVQTDDTDTYFGANVIVAEPPKDPRVSVTLFSTERTFDTREQAQTRIEAYLNKGPEWAGYLFENHIAGQRVIQLFQRTTDAIPNVGQTLVLIENEGLSTQKEQYVRATAVSSVERTFTYNSDQDYKAAVVTVDISDALRYDFTGSPATRTFTRATNSTKVRDTVVADAGTYVGVVPLTQAAAVGAFTIKGASIYTQLVPSAQTETPISFVPPYAAAGLPVPGASPVSYTATHAWTTTIKFNLPGGCLPGSLTIQTDGITIFDDAGLLKTASGTIGTIDYANGILTLNSGSMSNSKAVTYTPAAQILRAPQSSEVAITPESRSQSYVGTVMPIAQPGTLSISYMAQGRWYVLSDGGNGSLKGLDASYGAGTFNRNTGAYVVTLGALPDVGSSLILTWNVPTQETQQPATTLKASQSLVLNPPAGLAVQPGSLSVTWEFNGTKTATAATSGVLSGSASGSLSVAQHRVDFAPTILPSVGTQLTVDYVAGPKQEDSFAHPSRNGSGSVPVTAALGSIEPGSLEVEWNTLTQTTGLGVYQDGTAMAMRQWAAFQGAGPVRDSTNFRHQDGDRTKRASRMGPWQNARLRTARQGSDFQSATPDRRGWRVRFQDAVPPPPGISIWVVPQPPTPEPCYLPSAHLLFAAMAATDGALLFVCERGTDPTPPPGESIVVPVRRVYFVINDVTLYRVSDGAPVPVYSLSLSLDAASWAWGFEASLPAKAEGLVAPGNPAGPVELLARVNGTDFRVFAEGISRERAFGDASIRVSGRGRNAVLAAPYAPVLPFTNNESRTARQLMDDVLTVNGIPLGWTVDWGLTDWNVPAGAFAHQGTWIEALTTIASAAGGYLIPHPSNQSFRVRHRYPVAPWEWGTVTPDFVLPVDAVSRESLRWVDKPAYNRVFVSGQDAGVLGQVTRAGTAGNVLAPMVVERLITEVAAARQRGLDVLADTGHQIEVSLRLPVLAETGVIQPGAFVEYQDGTVTRLGIVRATHIEAGMPEVWQTLGVQGYA